MKRNMCDWLDEILKTEEKKAIPILSFPIASKMGITVSELLADSDTQAKGMKLLSDMVDTWASVSFMDLSVEAEAFGSKIKFEENEVPTVTEGVIRTKEDAEALEIPKVGAARTGIYIEGIEKAMRLITDKPVLAGCIGPFSLTGRLMDITEAMIKCRRDPEFLHVILKKVTKFLIEYINAYKAVGANGIAMAEPLAGLLSPKFIGEFSSVYVKEIIASVQDDNFIVLYHNCGENTIKAVDEILSTGADCYHFGNAINMAEMLEKMPEDVVVMGNVDPAVQFCNGTPKSIRNETLRIMMECCGHKNFVISSGCDIPANSPWENIESFFGTVKEFYGGRTV